MATILAVGLIALVTAKGSQANSRASLAGFEVFGVAALFIYIISARMFTEELHNGLGSLVEQVVSRGSILFPWSILVLLLMPQLLVALIGGWLGSRYRVNISIAVERRNREGTERDAQVDGLESGRAVALG
jgi:hypothetical protein